MLKKSLATAALALTALTGAVQADGNAMTILIDRVHDDFTPGANFFFEAEFFLPGQPLTAMVGVGLPNGTEVTATLDEDDPGSPVWAFELDYSDFEDLKLAANGPWTVTILGTGLYVSTFNLNLTGFNEPDLYPIPVLTSPTSGQLNVPKDVTITWNDPSGGQADVLAVECGSWNESESLEQEVLSIDGDIALSATNWKPPVDLLDGENELAIAYFNFDQTRVTPLVSLPGFPVLNWGTPPIDTPLIPGMPLLVFGSENIIAFEVGVEEGPVCTGDTDEDGTVGFSDLLSVLSAWGCTDCPEDLDESGAVDFGDLLAVLSAWGPCDV